MYEGKDREPSVARVNIDLSREYVPELLGLLGDFAAKRDVAIHVNDVAPTPNAQANELAYNASMVSLLPAPDSDELVPVVTRFDLKQFAEAADTGVGRKSGYPERIINELGAARRKNPRLNDMLLSVDSNCSDVGIRVDKLQLLIHDLQAGHIELFGYGIGVKSIDFLKKYSRALFADSPS